MADPAEVRAWARDNGHEVGANGRIPREIQDAYDAAHAPDPDYPDVSGGGVPYPPDDGSMGVTEADFPPLDPDDLEPDQPATPDRPRSTRVRQPRAERKPRAVKPPRKTWKQMFGGTSKPKARGPRTDLCEFAEDTWRDLAMIASGIPPLSKVLTVQAPYVGGVFDEAVRGVPFVDAVLQPVAKYSISLRALNGLIGPPVITMAICTQGEWMTNEAGQAVIDQQGRPVPTQRTAMMLGMLKYSLAQMARTADMERVAERAAEDADRMRAVDALVDMIFGFPAATPQAPAPGEGDPRPAPPSPPPAASPGQVLVPSFIYPPPPKPEMDDVGARA